MIKINIRHNFPEVMRSLKKLEDNVAHKVLAKSLNKTITQSKNKMASTISKEFVITSGKAKERLDVSFARYRNGTVVLSAELMAKRPDGLFGNSDRRGMNLINFVKALPKRNAKGKLGPLYFQIKKNGGRKTLRGAFVATSRKTKGTAVFVRVGKERMPIETKTTIDVPQMFNTKRINEIVRKTMLDNFEKNFQRELRGVLQGWAK